MNRLALPRRLIAAGAAALAMLSLSACVVAPLPGYYGDVVGVAPPAPQVEVYGAPPVAGHIWIGGYWGWRGGRHQWTPGYWSAPRAGYHWHPHRWDRAPGGWRERPGYWQRR